MKYTLKEMCNNGLTQNLKSHTFKFLWNRYFVMVYVVKEILDKYSSTLTVSDYAALNALLRDFQALKDEDRYNLFKQCEDGDWHSTVLKMARKYLADEGSKYLAHSKSLYLSEVRMLSSNQLKPIHNDPSLIILQFDESVGTISDGMYSDNPNLSTVILGKRTYYVGRNAFANCPNLKDVYADNPGLKIEDGALPEGVTVHLPTSGDSHELDEVKAELNAAKAELSKCAALKAELEKLKSNSSDEIDKVTGERDSLRAEIEQLKTASSKELEEVRTASSKELEEIKAASSKELDELKASTSKQIEQLMDTIASLQEKTTSSIDKTVADVITSMLPNGAKMIERAEADKEFADTVLMSTYEKCLLLKYKFDVTSLQRGETLDAKISALSKHSENDYVKAMSTLNALNEEGRLSSRHLDAIRKLTGDVDKKSTYKEKILSTLEEHGYTESDYAEKYAECLSTVNRTELKYTPEKDRDKLVASRMEEFLSNDVSIENAIRKHRGLDLDADVSNDVQTLEMMYDVLDGTFDGMSKEQAMLSLVDKLS